jgi:hypothetical protein
MLDNILKLSRLFYKLASTWGGLIRGEWWLNEDGSSEFADLDIGERGRQLPSPRQAWRGLVPNRE